MAEKEKVCFKIHCFLSLGAPDNEKVDIFNFALCLEADNERVDIL